MKNNLVHEFTARVCSVHFDQCSYKEKPSYLLGCENYSPKKFRKLKDDAIPIAIPTENLNQACSTENVPLLEPLPEPSASNQPPHVESFNIEGSSNIQVPLCSTSFSDDHRSENACIGFENQIDTPLELSYSYSSLSDVTSHAGDTHVSKDLSSLPSTSGASCHTNPRYFLFYRCNIFFHSLLKSLLLNIHNLFVHSSMSLISERNESSLQSAVAEVKVDYELINLKLKAEKLTSQIR